MISQSETTTNAILVIDDDTDAREALCDLLQMVGYAVRCVENGQEALNYLHETHSIPRLILLDLYMPVMDGWEFMRRLHNDPDIADLPVVVLSAADRPRAADAEFVLQKPVNVAKLMDTVARFVAPKYTDA